MATKAVPQAARRPKTHEIGDVGVAEIRRLFLRQGWIVNEIHSDYGEDLMLQPTSFGEVEKYRAYAQVKSTSLTNRRSVVLRSGDLFLWQFERDPFLLLVWSEPERSAYFAWLNVDRDPKKYLDGASVRIPLSQMRLLTPEAIRHIASELRNIAFTETLRSLSSCIEQNGGFKSRKRIVHQAKVAAIKIARRMLIHDGVFLNHRTDVRVSSDFMIDHLDNIVLFASGLGNSKRKLMRVSPMSWACFLVGYVWAEFYENQPDDYLFWALANVVEITTTGIPGALDLFRSRVTALL